MVQPIYLLGDVNLPYSVSVDYDDVAQTWDNVHVINEAGAKAVITVNGVDHIVPDGTDQIVQGIGPIQLVQFTNYRGQTVWGRPNLSYSISFSAAAKAKP